MRLATTSFLGSFLSRTPRFAIRLVFSLLIFAVRILSFLIYRQSARVVFGQAPTEVVASLNLVVRDSMTGLAVHGEVDAKGKNGLATFSTNADGGASYQLSSGRNDLEVDVAENSTLTTNEFNRAFVLMQYFGYLRRNPNDPPEASLDHAG